MSDAEYTFHEDFSGAGMARMGLGDKWECVRACDIDAKKCDSYRANFGADHLFEGSIADVKIAEAKPAHLAWASFPCQDTSLAGGYAGLDGERSTMFWKWMRIVEEMENAGKPFDIVCVENVRGLLTSNGGKDFASIAGALAKANYSIGAAIIDAVNFLPQSRERLFIIGVKMDKRHLPAFASKNSNPYWHPYSMLEAHKEHFAKHTRGKWFWLDLPRPSIAKPTLEEIITDDPEGVEWHTAEQTARLIELMSEENRRKLQEQKKAETRSIGMLYKRMRNGEQRAEIRFDGIAGCLRTATGGSSRQTVMIVEGNNVRSRLISPREAAKLMGLPDAYKLPAKYNDAYQLCGDGVAVPVVRFLAEQVFEPLLAKIAELKQEDSLESTSA
jgi:DNA (cytosine-5)-methyltransferase 1